MHPPPPLGDALPATLRLKTVGRGTRGRYGAKSPSYELVFASWLAKIYRCGAASARTTTHSVRSRL